MFLSLAAVCAVVFSMLLSSGGTMATADPVKEIAAGNLIGFDGCQDGNDAQEWHFVITSISDPSLAPATITVEWDGGAFSEVVPIDTAGHPPDGVTGGTAHYVTTSHLDSTVTAVTAVIYLDWSGNFNLSHAPCIEVTPTPTEEIPTSTPTEEIATETPTEVVTDTPTATPEEVIETPTEPVGGEEETPVPTATTAAPTPTESVTELPDTGAAPGNTGTSGMLAAALLAVVLGGTGLALRRRTVGNK